MFELIYYFWFRCDQGGYQFLKFPNFDQEYIYGDKDGVHPEFDQAEWPWSNMKRLFDTLCGETGEQIIND